MLQGNTLIVPMPSPSLRIRVCRSTKGLTALLLIGAFVLATGCSARFPAERIPRLQWLVLPLSEPPGMDETPRAIQGWWFGARTIRQNPRSGEEAAQVLARHLAGLGYINLYSPIDLRYYFADKRQALQTAYPHLAGKEIEKLLADVPKIKFGKELGADRILSGRIVSLYMGENRTIHWWWATADVELEVINVATGETIWSKRYFEREQFASQDGVLEAIAERAMQDLQNDVFLPMAQ